MSINCLSIKDVWGFVHLQMENLFVLFFICKFISNFDVLDSHNRFITILTSHEKDVSHFAFSGFKKRMVSDWAIFLKQCV